MKSPRPTFAAWTTVLPLGVVALACFAAYRSSLHAPFVFDDLPAITGNPSIQRLWPLSGPLTPPPGTAGADGRPLVNLSLALNYAWGGYAVEGYHVFNLVAHTLVAFILFGFARLTLSLSSVAENLRAHATLLATALALLWSVHPLLTESVTCVVQRNELLVAFFLLLTLYTLARSAGSPSAARWQTASAIACFCGVASKEVMAGAPLLALCYDRAFLAGSFAAAWRARWRYYLALAASWLLLGLLIARADRRSGTVGFGLTVSPWEYLLTQCHAIVLYLKLSLWPHPLVVDYGTAVVRRLAAVWLQATFLCALAAGTVWALARRPQIGWVAFCFFVLLAPSSSVVPLVTQTVAEHRMYLPLATLVAGAVLGLFALGGRPAVWLSFALVPVLALATARRNRDYRSGLVLWTDTVAHAPENARAHNNLGNMLVATPADLPAAIAQFRRALQLQPDYLEGLNNLGNALVLSGPAGVPEAIACFEHALRLDPHYASAHSNLGETLVKVPGRLDEAIAHLERAVALKPRFPEAQFNLALALAQRPGSAVAAIARFDLAIAQQPGLAEAHYYRANLLLAQPGRAADAIAGYETALRLNPAYPEAHHNLGTALARAPGRLDDAIAHFHTAIELKPDYFSAFLNLGLIYAELPGHETLARANLERALALRPDSALARTTLDRVNARRRP